MVEGDRALRVPGGPGLPIAYRALALTDRPVRAGVSEGSRGANGRDLTQLPEPQYSAPDGVTNGVTGSDAPWGHAPRPLYRGGGVTMVACSTCGGPTQRIRFIESARGRRALATTINKHSYSSMLSLTGRRLMASLCIAGTNRGGHERSRPRAG